MIISTNLGKGFVDVEFKDYLTAKEAFEYEATMKDSSLSNYEKMKFTIELWLVSKKIPNVAEWPAPTFASTFEILAGVLEDSSNSFKSKKK